MSRVHDMGGLLGLGPLAIETGEPPFHHEWEARVFAINRFLLRAGRYNLDEFRAALEQMPPAEYLEASYYERWLFAIESLIRSKGVLDVRGR
jgi:nitrile hydratase